MSHGPDYNTKVRAARHGTLADFERVFGHPCCEFERRVYPNSYQYSALLLVTQTQVSAIAKARWLVDHGASVGALLKITDSRDYALSNLDGGKKIAAFERLFRKHYAMVVRLIGLRANVPPLPLVLEQKVASFLV